ncbi:hypothetical protein EYB53_003360 [Candidatus Chloroploca sp. M-50]|uniref:Glycosyltransferase subfamily 4-like N-terminal domain-containing protein n=1 Tax=Candidatus Chloroploca mongolica TaxID=2528176 RepID=A0ABS4D5M8_9CHLR|nr:glycosyltransferase family 4 protein [Candidatus Chloroploca mongolica]MBP1464742.1 hypothetical protein [Candidatus Chloroploca mongolica]
MDLPHGQAIYRTYDLFTTMQRFGLFTALRKLRMAQHTASARSVQAALTTQRAPSSLKSIMQKVVQFEINVRSWMLSAYQQACSLIESGTVDAIFTTSPPHRTQLLGYWLKQRYPELPWVMDLRDLWSENRFTKATSGYHAAVQQERRCMQKADRVLVVTEGIRQLTLRQQPDLEEAKIVTLTNGYDLSKLQLGPDRKSHARFTVTHVGTWYASSKQDPLITALQAIHNDTDLVNAMQFRFIGHILPEIQYQLAAMQDHEFLVLRPPVTHHEALREILQADVALLKYPSDVPGIELSHGNKLFEYLGCGKTMLALVPPEGEAAQLIRQESAGIVVNPDDVDAIHEAIMLLFKQFQQEPHQAGAVGAYPHYDRKYLTGMLAEILDSLYEAKERKIHDEG